MTSINTLTLDTPEARRCISRSIRLLLRWADEDELETTVGPNTPDQETAPTAPKDDRQGRCQVHNTSQPDAAQASSQEAAQ